MQADPKDVASFSWSYSRDELLRACRRRYYHRYHSAREGWRPDAPAGARHAYRLAQLTTLDQVLGISLHARARELAASVLAGGVQPGYDALLERTRADLNRVCRASRDLAAFVRDPRREPVLLSVYYGRGLPPGTVERIRAKAEACLRCLVASPIWEELARCTPSQVHVLENPGTFEVDGIPVWAVPDLVFTPAGRRPVIVDWKSGRVDPVRAGEQLSLYGCFVRDGLALPPADGGYEGWIVGLAEGEDWSYDLSLDDLRGAEQRIRRGLDTVRALLGERPGAPAGFGSFPMTERRGRCPECPFWELCETEIRAGTGSDPGRIAP